MTRLFCFAGVALTALLTSVPWASLTLVQCGAGCGCRDCLYATIPGLPDAAKWRTCRRTWA